MKKVILTGATGLVGSHVAEKFRNEDIAITCLIRQSSNLSWIKENDLPYIVADILDKDSLVKALKEFDFCIHTAAFASDWGNYEKFYEINVKGTINILEACKLNGINDLIITGSISSYGEENCQTIKSEKSPYNSHYHYFADSIFPSRMNFYRDSKAFATQQAISFAEKNMMNLTIIEPAWVYGEREFNSGFYDYLLEVKNRMHFAPGSKKNLFEVIYAQDLAKAYFLVYQDKLVGINRFIVTGDTKIEMHKFYAMLCKAADLTNPLLLPKWLVYPIGFILELFATIIKSNKPPLLTRGRVNMFYDNIEYSSDKIRKRLNFENEYSLEESIIRTIDWYKENNLI